VELFSQYLDRLKQFVSVELANWPRSFVSDSSSPIDSTRTGYLSLTLATRSVTPTSETDTIEKLLWPFKYEQLVGKKKSVIFLPHPLYLDSSYSSSTTSSSLFWMNIVFRHSQSKLFNDQHPIFLNKRAKKKNKQNASCLFFYIDLFTELFSFSSDPIHDLKFRYGSFLMVQGASDHLFRFCKPIGKTWKIASGSFLLFFLLPIVWMVFWMIRYKFTVPRLGSYPFFPIAWLVETSLSSGLTENGLWNERVLLFLFPSLLLILFIWCVFANSCCYEWSSQRSFLSAPKSLVRFEISCFFSLVLIYHFLVIFISLSLSLFFSTYKKMVYRD